MSARLRIVIPILSAAAAIVAGVAVGRAEGDPVPDGVAAGQWIAISAEAGIVVDSHPGVEKTGGVRGRLMVRHKGAWRPMYLETAPTRPMPAGK